MRDFHKYTVWQNAHNLVLKIYEILIKFPDLEKYQLVSQMMRAAYSIPSNFSEGCGRSSDKDFNRFIQISLGSAHELEYFILLSKDLKYIDVNIFEELNVDVNQIKKQLFNLSCKLKE